MWVVEVKNRQVHLLADGERWEYRKFDQYGNLVEQNRATDRSGRTWGRQASDVGDALRWWLDRNQLDVPIRSAVVLVHPEASVTLGAHPGVDLVTADPHELVKAATFPGPVVPVEVRERASALIRRDHAHQRERDQQRERT